MMAYEESYTARDDFVEFICQFQLETKTLIRKLEMMLNKLYRQNSSLLFNETWLNIYIYIYIYIYMIYIYIYIYTRIIKKVSRLFSYEHFYWEYTHETLVPFEVISSDCNPLVVPFQQLLEGPIEVLLCERVNNLRHCLFHLLNCLITTTASELRE